MPHIFKTLKYIEIETCSACTRKCKWCLFGNVPSYYNKTNEFLETEYIIKIFEDLKEINFSGMLSLFSINEPLLDDRIVSGELIRIARKILNDSVSLIITTNGDLLTKNLCDSLFAAGLNKLVISCYDDKTLALAKEYYIRNSKIEVQDKRYFNEGHWEYNRAGSVVCSDNRRYKSCFIPYIQSVIGWDGNVRVCCYDAQATLKLGNIKEKSYLSILDSSYFNNLRKDILKQRQLIQPCNICNVDGLLRKR